MGKVHMLEKRSKAMSYPMYRAMCATKGMDPMDEDTFKALPVESDGDESLPGGAVSASPTPPKEKPGKPEGTPDQQDAPQDKPKPPDASAQQNTRNAPPGQPREDVSKSPIEPTHARTGATSTPPSVVKSPIEPTHARTGSTSTPPSVVKAESVGALAKALEAYEAVEQASQPVGGTREDYLSGRLKEGTITKSEQAELGRIWSGLSDNPAARVDTGESLQKSLREYVGNGEVVDASPILKSLVDGLEERMGNLGDVVALDGKATRELLRAQGGLLKALVGALADVTEVNKGLVERVEHVEATPAPRRSVDAPVSRTRQRPIGRTGIGESGDVQPITKGETLSALRALTKSASELKDKPTVDLLMHETAKFEQFGQLHPGVAAMVRETVRS